MYLSQLLLNPRSRQVRVDLADRYELHRTILNAFPETLPDDERVLYRVEEGTLEPIIRLLVQSQTTPNWEAIPRLRGNYLLDVPQVRTVVVRTPTGVPVRFRLQANPTVKRDGKRHAIYKNTDLEGWLVKKTTQSGFTVDPAHMNIVKLGKKRGKGDKVWNAVQFDGVLTVTDTDLFTQTVQKGVGSAKAFGFGLLSIPLANA
jgi:CRISPR system Cascade subunit CasE